MREKIDGREVVWVMWVDSAAGSVAVNWEWVDDSQWLSPGPHYTKCGTYDRREDAEASAREQMEYYRKLEAERDD